jgi:hypothetical protein
VGFSLFACVSAHEALKYTHRNTTEIDMSTAERMENNLVSFIKKETGHSENTVVNFVRNACAVKVAMEIVGNHTHQTFNGPEISRGAIPYFQTMAGMCISYIEAGHNGRNLFFAREITPTWDDFDDYGAEPTGYTKIGEGFKGVAYVD